MRVLIIGQGLAGTLLHYSLWKKGVSADVVDQGHEKASTALAAGIINPVTGRNPKKGWMIDTLWPVAKENYEALEQLLLAYKEDHAPPLWNEMPFFRPLKDMASCNDWDAIMASEGMTSWVQEVEGPHPFQPYFPGAMWGIVRAARVNVRWLIRAYRQWIIDADGRGQFFPTTIKANDISSSGPLAIYQGREYDVVVACTGAFREFQRWPDEWIKRNKGEALLVNHGGGELRGMLKAGVLVAPLEQGVVWIGSKDTWNPADDLPTSEGWEHLYSGWQGVFQTTPQVLEHRAALRPVTQDRRPILGRMEGTPWAIFNGLGTKGTSLGPYWAERMAEFLLGNAEIPVEAGTARFS